ncbi:hypothetical protein [Duganella aceris]|uniref:Mobilization protein MobX n=1 Tax=Duganella aceris TaxID=2703883 RepID=A0ABX0FF35_9BURK|nr:hypothetical protein [Duganella aceris]NGZ83144.1 hypothetical protein [Duganella aceris]
MTDHDRSAQSELFDTLHDKLDAHKTEVERFHQDVGNFSRQVAGCDKLLRLANTSLTQIDAKIAEAARIEARAGSIAGAVGQEAGRAAAQAAAAAVDELTHTVAALSAEADQVRRALNRSMGRTGLWLGGYIAFTLTMCVLTALAAYGLARRGAVTPEIAHYAELGRAHQSLLNKAGERELKTINAILARPDKQK